MDVVLVYLAGFAFILICLAIVAFIVLIPAIIAFRRQHPNRWLILAVCAFLGGTGIGWAVALVWALHAAHRSPDASGSNGGESGLNLFANDIKALWSDGVGAAQAGNPAEPQLQTLDDTLQHIERLERLRATGGLDEAEFASLKAAALRQVQAT